MESQDKTQSNSSAAYVWAVLGALLIVAVLVYVMQVYTAPKPLGQERADYRLKTLVELRAADQTELFDEKNYAWADQKKGIVRMPIGRSKELFLQLYQNPAKGRAELIAREEKFRAVPPPVALE